MTPTISQSQRERVCQVCGCAFVATPFQVRQGWGKYCSRPCKGIGSRGSRRPFWDFVDRSGGLDSCWRWTRPGSDRRGYGRVLWDGKYRGAHVVVFLMAHGSIPEGHAVLHHCDHPWCVNPLHLWSGTFGDNNRDSAKKGRNARGERNAKAKLTEADVLEIRRLRAGRLATYEQVSQRFGISHGNIAFIVKRATWKHI